MTQGTISAVAAVTERFSIRKLSRNRPPGVEEVALTASFDTARMGRFSDRNFLQLVKEKSGWRVQWSPAAVIRDLQPKGRLALRPGDGSPERGRILDRNGRPLAYTEQIITIGIVPGRMLAQHPERPGKDLQVSLEPEVQRAAEHALGDATGALVVIDVADRSVLAAASTPGYDPNLYGADPFNQTWRWLVSDGNSGMQNRATASYPAGSLVAYLAGRDGVESIWLAAFQAAGAVPGLTDTSAPARSVSDGQVRATAVQLAGVAAAVAGDGVLWTPQLFLQAADRECQAEQRFPVRDLGRLPLTPAERDALQTHMRQAMLDPNGGLYPVFIGLDMAPAGLTVAIPEEEQTPGEPDWRMSGISGFPTFQACPISTWA